MPKTIVFDPKEWLASVVPEGVTLTDEQTQAMETVLAVKDIGTNIGNAVLRQSDYSRQSDELKVEREAVKTSQAEVDATQAEVDAFVIKQKDRDHNNLSLHEQMKKDLATANARTTALGGEITAPLVTETVEEEPNDPMLTIKDYEAREAARDAQTIQLQSRMITLANQHRKDFGEDFDPDATVAYATEKGLNLDDAYTELNADKFAEKTEADIQARIDTAVKDNEIELRSRNDFPETIAGPTRVQGLDQPEAEKLKTEDARVGGALKALATLRSA